MREFGSAFPRIHGEVPGRASRALRARLAAVESRNVTAAEGGLPTFWEEALGLNVRDVDGNVLLDLTGAFGVAVAGHRHPRIVEALRTGAWALVHGMGDVHPARERVELLERLAALAPWESTRGILATSGSEAVEAALKTALLRTGHPGILAFEGGYHGLTAGALAATERSHFRAPFEPRLFPGVAFAPFPSTGTHEPAAVDKVLEEIGRALAEGAPEGSPIGAVLVEPIQGRAGVRTPPPGFLPRLAELVRAHGAVFILDEIFTGLGRTGDLFALQTEEVVPDLLVIGKALGGGLPLSACLGPEEVMDAWPPSSGEAIHTSTFLGHPLACRCALAFLSVLDEEELAGRARNVGAILARALGDELAELGSSVEIRGRGLFLGVTLKAPGGVPMEGAGARAAAELLRRGLLTLPAGASSDVVELTPPLILDEELARFAAAQVAQVVRQIMERA